MPKISIIMTSYNRPIYAKQAIDSIIAQTEKDWELIIIDDCSTISEVNDVLNEAAKDKRVKLWTSETNINNLPILWNRGLDFSSGKYICLLDDDNKREPEYLKKLSGFLDANPEYPAVACFAKILQGEVQTAIFDGPIRMNKEKIKYNNYIDSGCMMFRHSVIDEIGWFDERLRSCDDWDFVKRIVLQTDHGFGVIQESLAIYRWHEANRSYIKNKLGDVENQNFIVHQKNYNRVLNVLLFHQDKTKITLSQNNVLAGVCSALKKLPFVNLELISLDRFIQKIPERLYDIVFIFAPFSIDLKVVEAISCFGKEVVHFHIEDPQALGTNLERTKFATYIFTNDQSVIEYYEKVIGYGNVGFCPSVSLDDINLVAPPKSKKEYGIVFYGYAYDSRKKYIAELEQKLKAIGQSLTVIGGGWEKKNKNYIGEISQIESLEILSKSKIVILKNRENTDLGGDPKSIKPQSVVRGYFECGAGSLIMLDNSREHHSFNENDIVFYGDMDDLITKIDYYMKHRKEREAIALQGKNRVWQNFTYQKRMRQLINAIRSRRFYFEIK